LTIPVFNAVIKARENPDWFCRHILRSPNDKWQSEVMQAVADVRRARLGIPTRFNHKALNRITIAACHGVGKTHIVAKIMHWFNYGRVGLIPCTAPKIKQVTTRLFPEFRRAMEKADPEYRSMIDSRAEKITWNGDTDHCAIAESGQQPENLAGYHHKNLMFVVDEASGVHENLFPAVEGSLSTEDALLLLIGNPTRTSGEFWASHKKTGTKELYYQKQVSYKDSPRVSEKWAQNMIQKYGLRSSVVMVRVFGVFPEMADNQLIMLGWIEDARQNIFPNLKEKPKLRVSIDVADGGEDETSITAALHYEDYILILRQKNFNFPSSESPIKAAETAERIFQSYGGDKASDDFVVDSLGVGAGTAGYLIKQGYNVVRHKGGESATDKEQFRNKRSQVWFSLRNALRDGWLFIAEDAFETSLEWDNFCAQLCSIQTKLGTEKYEEIITKMEMKTLGIKSPDRGDSISMQFSPVVDLAVTSW